jgi:hypothetical protein
MEEARQEQKKEVIKHSAAIQIHSSITLLQRRAWNVLLYNAYNELPTEAAYSISVLDLAHILEYDSHNQEYLKEALRALVTCGVEWNILGKDGAAVWGVTTLLAHVEIEHGVCSYSYSLPLRQRLHNPSMYARLDLNLQNRFESKHAQALWELCVDYLGHRREYGETPYIGLEHFKKLMGIEAETYALFKLLSQWVLKPAIAEINRVSDFHVEVEYQREGRKVTGLKFKIRRVTALPAAISGQRDLFPDLQDIPLAVKLLNNAGLALQEAFSIWQQGWAYVDADKRPASATGDRPDEAFINYVREKIHLLETRKKQGKANNPTGFLLTALKTNYGNADFVREEAAKATAAKRKELKKLQDGMDAVTRGEDDAVMALTRKVIDAMPTMLDEALEAARQENSQENNGILRFCYKEDKTPLQNFEEHPAIVTLVGKCLEGKFPKQYEEARAPFLRQRSDAEARIKELEAEGIRVYA